MYSMWLEYRRVQVRLSTADTSPSDRPPQWDPGRVMGQICGWPSGRPDFRSSEIHQRWHPIVTPRGPSPPRGPSGLLRSASRLPSNLLCSLGDGNHAREVRTIRHSVGRVPLQVWAVGKVFGGLFPSEVRGDRDRRPRTLAPPRECPLLKFTSFGLGRLIAVTSIKFHVYCWWPRNWSTVRSPHWVSGFPLPCSTPNPCDPDNCSFWEQAKRPLRLVCWAC